MQTPDPRHAASEPPPVAGGLDGVRGLGADLLAAVDLDAITARLLQLPTAALLAELEAVVAAVEHTDPDRSRRRTGWWGRLLGRDLVAQAQPDPVDSRIRLHLTAAQTQAEALATGAAALEPVADELLQRIADLEALIDRERAAPPIQAAITPIPTAVTPNPTTVIPSETRDLLASQDSRSLANARDDQGRAQSFLDSDRDAAKQRRLAHLELVATSWRAAITQIALARSYATQLLDRHAQVRDVFAALWRERTAAQAAATQLAPDRLARLHESLRDLRAATPTYSAPAADTDRPTQEPSP